MTTNNAGLIKQFRALVPYSIGNAFRARWSSLTIIACVLLVVVILCAFLSMARGFAATAQSGGSDNVIVFLGEQSQSEANSQVTRDQLELLANAPGLTKDGASTRLSPELTMTVSSRKIDGTKVNATLRGLTPEGFGLREGFRITQGRLPQPGRYELIVGRKLRETVAESAIGSSAVLAGRRWLVVGEYALGSPVFEGEFLADLGSVQSAYGRENQFQSVRARLASAAGMDAVRRFVAADPRLLLEARSERQLYAEQVKDTTNLIMYLGWPLAAILSIGALAGVFNTMLIVLEGRRNSLRVLEMLGFSPAAVVLSVLLETVFLAIIGAVLGTALVWLVTLGAQTTIVGNGFTTITYNLRVDGIAFAQGLGLAVLIGLLGGAVPSLRLVTGRKS